MGRPTASDQVPTLPQTTTIALLPRDEAPNGASRTKLLTLSVIVLALNMAGSEGVPQAFGSDVDRIRFPRKVATMPIVHITLSDAWTPVQARGISDAVHASLMEAFRIPGHDYIHRINRSGGNDGLVLSLTKSVKTVVIEMTIFPGRSREAKAALYKSIAERLSEFGIASHEILVALHELPMENWGIRGLPADQVDLGFETRV
jgi:phenylpyruvate tautomerase PptA (4-oxalocrotonate tautomerase family)